MSLALVPRPRDKAETPEKNRAPGPVGLGDGSESDAASLASNSPRERMPCSGVTRLGVRTIKDAGVLIDEDDVRCWGFWTVTIPREAVPALCRSEGGWKGFQDRLRRRLGEKLGRRTRRAALSSPATAARIRGRGVWKNASAGLWLFTVEPQEDGTPHIHCIFRARQSANGRWLLRREDFDELIEASLAATTGQRIPCPQAGFICSLASASKGKRRGGGDGAFTASYLIKYATKGAKHNPRQKMESRGAHSQMIPASWWGVSDAVRRSVAHHTRRIPPSMTGAISLLWRAWADAGLCDGGVWTSDSPGAPGVVCLRWRRFEDFQECLRCAWEWSWDHAT